MEIFYFIHCRTYTLSGSYRKIFGKVEDLTWKIVNYNDPTDNLILSDLQQLKGETKLQIDESKKNFCKNVLLLIINEIIFRWTV